MANKNNIIGNIWLLTEANPDVPVKDGITLVNAITWQAYANPNHRFSVTDDYGAVIAEGIGSSDWRPVTISFGNPIPVRGLRLAAIDSGEVSVVIE